MAKILLQFYLYTAIAFFIMPATLLAASFDCSKANTKTEKAICDDSTLSKLDDDLAASYSKALKTGDRDIVKKGQRKWLKEKLAPCHEDKECIKKAYKARIQELSSTVAMEIQSPAQSKEIVSKNVPLECPQCGVWQLSTSEPAGLVGDIVSVNDHQIVIPGCGVFTYEVEKAKTKVEREDIYIYNLSLLLSPRGELSLLCEGRLDDKWKMDVKVRGRGSADLVLSKLNEKQPILWLEGWNIDREGHCDWGGGLETARCKFIKERLVYKILSIKVEEAYQKLLKDDHTTELPTFSAARFSAIVAKFCTNKEKDSGGASWPYAWAYTCKNRILGAKLEEFSAWQACMEKNKNIQKTCKFPTEGFDRSPKLEAEE